MNALVAYFSRAGQNYVNGVLKNLDKGNTEVVAEIIRDCVGGDLYKIESFVSYPAGYKECCDVAAQEKSQNARPVLKNPLPDVSRIDTLYVGFPNWWNTMPMAVCTFLEAIDWSGKKIIPFCVHEGSGLGSSEADIRRLCPRAKFGKGFEVKSSEIEDVRPKIIKWLNS